MITSTAQPAASVILTRDQLDTVADVLAWVAGVAGCDVGLDRRQWYDMNHTLDVLAGIVDQMAPGETVALVKEGGEIE